MNHYRLLRDNKESGPYSQEDLILKGFKPYDLIWVEGKSAGWRYPSEIEELKKFAPVVEEQPYDRFFKKPAQQRSPATEEKSSRVSYTSSVPAKKEEEPAAKIQTREPAYTIQPMPARHIHVTLPSGNTVNVTTINTNNTRKEAVEEKPRFSPIPAEEKKPVFAETITRNYSQPAIETQPVFAEAEKSSHVPVYPQAAYNNNAGFSWTMILGLFVGVATLVGLGVMIGLSISRQKNDVVLNSVVPQKPKVKEPAVNVPAAEDKTSGISQNTDQPQQRGDKELVRNAVIKTVVPSGGSSNPVKDDKPQAGLNKPDNPVNNQPETTLPKKPATPVSVIDIEKQVNVTTNGYKVGAFGGISELQCTLVNDSKFALDAVEVEVQYIQANDKVYKTEKLSFKDIAAGTQVTLNAPKSPRGVKVVSRIIKINSKEPGLLNTTVKS